MMLRIKKLSPEDTALLNACAGLERICLPSEAWSFKSLQSEAKMPYGCVLAALNEENRLIGVLTARYISGAEDGELMILVVSPEYRRQGIGSMLLSDLFSRIGNIRLFLEVRESNPAREFYQKYGFEQFGVRKRFYQNPEEDAILMQYRGEESC